MPLEDGYGVVIGTLHDYFRDPVNEFGQYYHANAMLRAPAGTYHCAIATSIARDYRTASSGAWSNLASLICTVWLPCPMIGTLCLPTPSRAP